MPRRIVLHMGFHKTGTSTVQQFLRANRKALMPVAAIRLKNQMPELMHATRGYSTWRDPLTLAKVSARFDALLADLPGMARRTLILSAEELSGHMPGRDTLVDYSAAVDLAQLYAEVSAARFPKADLIFYFTLRDPAGWLESAYWEHVKSSSMTLDFDAFAQQYGAAAQLGKTVDAVRSVLPHTVASTSIDHGGDTITRLLDLCDVPDAMRAELTTVPVANMRLPHAVLLELLAANRAYPDRTDRKAAKQEIIARMRTS
jgi:hypothetical protein